MCNMPHHQRSIRLTYSAPFSRPLPRATATGLFISEDTPDTNKLKLRCRDAVINFRYLKNLLPFLRWTRLPHRDNIDFRSFSHNSFKKEHTMPKKKCSRCGRKMTLTIETRERETGYMGETREEYEATPENRHRQKYDVRVWKCRKCNIKIVE